MKFFIRQLIKMFVQSVVLPLVYNVSKKKNIDDRLVIFVDAHHDSVPFSMERMRDTFLDTQYNVVEMYTNYQTEGYIKVVKEMISFMKLYANAKYVFICDNFLPVSSCNIRKETQVIQLWHAGGLLKKYAYDTEDDIPKYYKGNVFKNYTLTTVSAECCIPVYIRAMKQKEGTVKATGLSRTDCFFDEQYINKCREDFYNQYPEAKGKKIILWAPTFRGKALNPHVLGLEDVKNLAKELGDDYYVVMKMHPHLDAKEKLSNCDISTERIIPLADMLIADYSSVIFDFTLYQRPMILFAPDYDEFVSTRGLYIDLNEIPGTILKDGSRLKEVVINEFENFDKENAKAFYEKYMGACDGKATYRILEEIKAII